MGLRGSHAGLILFGHACVISGCFLIMWGIYLLPYSQPTLSHVFGRPLFWGLFSLMGDVCAIYQWFLPLHARLNSEADSVREICLAAVPAGCMQILPRLLPFGWRSGNGS